jgi:hypothetical protein
MEKEYEETLILNVQVSIQTVIHPFYFEGSTVCFRVAYHGQAGASQRDQIFHRNSDV